MPIPINLEKEENQKEEDHENPLNNAQQVEIKEEEKIEANNLPNNEEQKPPDKKNDTKPSKKRSKKDKNKDLENEVMELKRQLAEKNNKIEQYRRIL